MSSLHHTKRDNSRVATQSRQSTYTTKAGENIQYSMLFSADNESVSETDKPESALFRPERQGPEKDFALVERQWTLDWRFNFHSKKGRIESAADVAYIFRQLESEAIEHAFLVYQKSEGDYYVQWIGSGSSNETLIDYQILSAGIERFKPDKIYFVHNHPDGSLVPSEADFNTSKDLLKICTSYGIDFHALIINLSSGKFSEIGITDRSRKLLELPSVGEQIPVHVYSFSKQVFLQSYNPNRIRSTREVAAYLSKQRFGIGPKAGVLILNVQNAIHANFFIDPDFSNTNKITQDVAYLCALHMGGQVAFYGNIGSSLAFAEQLTEIKEGLLMHGIIMHSFVSVSPSQAVRETFHSITNNRVATDPAHFDDPLDPAAERPMQASNLKATLENNRLVLETMFRVIGSQPSGPVNKEDKEVLQSFQGFAPAGSLLLNHPYPDTWKDYERPLHRIIEQIFTGIQNFAGDDSSILNAIHESLRNSVLTSYYTPNELTKIITSIIPDWLSSGEKETYILEPSAGSGRFIQSLLGSFDSTRVHVDAIEKDKLTAMLLQAIYRGDDAVKIINQPFENTHAELRRSGYDAIISNIPFGNIKVFDKAAKEQKDALLMESQRQIHDYYFIRSIRHLKDGGILSFITSSNFTDSDLNTDFRKGLCEKGNILSNIKLPTNLFEESNTAVQTNYILFQRDFNKSNLDQRDKLFIQNPSDEGHPFGQEENSLFNNFNMRSSAFSKSSPHYDFSGTYQQLARAFRTMVDRQAEVYKKPSKTMIVVPEVRPERAGTKKNKANTGQLSLFDTLFTEPAQEKLTPASVEYTAPIFRWYREGLLVYEPTSHIIGRLKVTDDGRGHIEPMHFTSMKDFRAQRLLIQIRDSYQILYEFEQLHEKEEPLLRLGLNNFYDKFVAEFGVLNERHNRKYFSLHDSSHFFLNMEMSVMSGVFKKSDIFEKCLFLKPEVPESLHTIDGLAYSLNQCGRVNLDMIVAVTGKDKASIIDELHHKIYYNAHSYQWEEAAYFLSGDIYQKIDDIEARLENDQEVLSGEMMDHCLDALSALRSNIPKKIPFAEIGIQLGERWLPVDYYKEFADRLFQTQINIKYIPSLDEYRLEVGRHGYNALINAQYAVPGEGRSYDGLQVMEQALIDKVPHMSKKIVASDGKTITVPDKDAIELFKGKVETLRGAFLNYLFELPQARKDLIESLYNRIFNASKKLVADGSHLKLEDLKGFEARFYQKDSAWQIIQNHGGILDLPVGAGKTLVLIIAAHEMKRLGLVKKPMICALKATVTQIAATYKLCYPYDNVLYPSEKDFEKDNRENIFHQIANNEWDCVILTHEQFKAIPQSLVIQQRIIQEEVNQLGEDIIYLQGGSMSKRALRGLELRKGALEAHVAELSDSIKRNRNIVDFNKMGIDKLFIDESQHFKNLFYHTRHQNVSGLGNPEGSQRAFNLYIALQTLQEKAGQKDLQATFSSGSTIKNSIVEMFLLFKYLRPNALKKYGCPSFDRWASVFALKSSEYEFNVNGEIRIKDRFRTFIKVPELSKMYADITYYMHPKQLNIEKPKLQETLISIEPTPAQREYIAKLIEFANNPDPAILGLHHSREKAELCKMLICTDLGKKMTMDMRMIDAHRYEDEPGSKLSKAAANIWEIYQSTSHFKGTQLVFSDIGAPNTKGFFSAYKELKRKLIELGIPTDEIAFIHDATSDAKRDKLFEKIKKGEIRVIIGSTQKLGTGVNCQERIIAVHHLDIPWTPEDMNQRNGRAARNGNIFALSHNNNLVQSFVYATNNTIDVFRFQLLRNKQEFIEQIKVNENGARTVDEGSMDESSAMGYAEFVAVLSGNRLLVDKMKTEMKVVQLERERRSFYNNQGQIKNSIQYLEREIEQNKSTLEKLGRDLNVLVQHPIPLDEKGNKIFSIEFKGKIYHDAEQFGTVLLEECNKRTTLSFAIKVGSLRGFGLYVEQKYADQRVAYAQLAGVKYMVNNGLPNSTPQYAGRYFHMALDKAEDLEEHYKRELEKNNKDVELLRNNNGVWPKEAELIAVKMRLQSIAAELEQSNKQATGQDPADQDSDIELTDTDDMTVVNSPVKPPKSSR